MNNQIYSLVYCSRNQISGSMDHLIGEVQQILVSARSNNARVGVTGALLFNEGLFAQVLEGPQAEVERIFEIIQYDPRHSDVTILQTGVEERRRFPDWSMAFASPSGDSSFESVAPIFDKAFANPSGAGKEVLTLLHELVLQEDWMMSS
jgi:blue light- and temperature-responsive anti-repressor